MCLRMLVHPSPNKVDISRLSKSVDLHPHMTEAKSSVCNELLLVLLAVYSWRSVFPADDEIP